jgi:hypothetical protein
MRFSGYCGLLFLYSARDFSMTAPPASACDDLRLPAMTAIMSDLGACSFGAKPGSSLQALSFRRRRQLLPGIVQLPRARFDHELPVALIVGIQKRAEAGNKALLHKWV